MVCSVGGEEYAYVKTHDQPHTVRYVSNDVK